MTTPSDTGPLFDELTTAILSADKNTLAFVEQLGQAYEETKTWPSRWLSKVVTQGVAAGLSKELIRHLILKDFKDRDVQYDTAEVNEYIDGLFADKKEQYDRDPELFKAKHAEIK